LIIGFIALIFALLIEQGRPLPADNAVYRLIGSIAQWVRNTTNAGSSAHGMVGWLIMMVSAVVGISLLHWLSGKVHPVLQFALHVLVLYWTVGFRQFSHAFSEIQKLLADGKVDDARETLRKWLAGSHDDDMAETLVAGKSLRADQRADLPLTEICRLAIADSLVAAHRHVFGPLLWYVLLPGLIGPIIYRLAELLARLWAERSDVAPVFSNDPLHEDDLNYGEFAAQAYYWIDWPAVRLSSAAFAVVGNFEDAIYCWRGAAAARFESTADLAAQGNEQKLFVEQRALLIATGGGALGLRIADADMQALWNNEDSGFDWQGAEPDARGLHSAVGLVWRSVILWITLFAMITIATWLGR
jgi:adenosylcobinamide-phosphate synthase